MIDRVERRFGLHPGKLAADSAYGSAEMLNWLVEERGIEPHIPVFDKSQRSDDTFSRSDFTYDHEGDVSRHFMTAIPCERAPQFCWQFSDMFGERGDYSDRIAAGHLE